MDLKRHFFELTTDKVLNAVEAVMAAEKLGARPTGRVLALNSLENRVFEIEYDDHSYVVAKFYRPHRWSQDQIEDEHEFLIRLEEVEIPVVAPFELESTQDFWISPNIETLSKTDNGIFFAVFPKVKGRLTDELKASQLETLGRYLGRLHTVGREWQARYRLSIDSEYFLDDSLRTLSKSSFLSGNFRAYYLQVANDFLKIAKQRLTGIEKITLHGDCHLGNVLWNGEAPFLLDFDDAMLGPPVQDIWMVVRNRGEEAQKSLEHLLKGYEQMASFDHQDLSLIEVLRGIRILYYSAWIERRWDDPSFQRAFPLFSQPDYWQKEIEALRECYELLVGVI